MIEKFDVVIGDDNRIVDQNSERYNQTRDRDLMKRNPGSVQHAQRRSDGHRDGGCGDYCDTNREQDDRHYDYGPYGEQELAFKILDSLANDRRLIGDQIELEVGRQKRPDLGKRRADQVTQIVDVPSFLHFYGVQYTRLAIEPRYGVWILVPAFVVGKISYIDPLNRVSGNIHEDLLDLFLGNMKS